MESGPGNFVIGQRWISEMEPELGLGTVSAVDRRVVTLDYPASGTIRHFAIASAPLRRVRFYPGDTVSTRDERTFRIISVHEQEGLLFYVGEALDLCESALADTIGFNTPRDRLLNGYIDSNAEYLLRLRTHQRRHQWLKSPLHGLIGGRIELIPHQLYVAARVASHPNPRILLSDETGLGKTIEAALVMHRLLITGRISRVLLCVPEPLVHQWFVELLRRFNLIFRIIDADYLESLAPEAGEGNFFHEEQLALVSLDFLTGRAGLADLALQAGWDLLVIDEAHHLVNPGPAYSLAQALCAVIPGVLLLTATPEQLGHASHFSRLQLLDPEKYRSLEEFEAEEEDYGRRASLLGKLLEGEPLSDEEEAALPALAPDWAAREGRSLPQLLRQDAGRREQFIDEVVDRQGTGRAVFRNTRAGISGFPERRPHLIPLSGGEEDDPLLSWLAQFLREHRRVKVLFICRTAERAMAAAPALQRLINIKIALFHEQLSLLQRDRNASWFAEPDGARVLICSEIGSEGRNFQFCHHLFFYDLPDDPELLEQRIGRLDRIGQTATVELLVPYLTGSGQEVLARWYHEGLDAFRATLTGAHQIHAQFREELERRVAAADLAGLDALIVRTQEQREAITAALAGGRDQLLALNSCRPDRARALQEAIARADGDAELEKYCLRIFELYGILADEISSRTYQLNLALLSQPGFPLPAYKHELLVVTFDRQTALRHEEIEFLTWDHPMVSGAMDLLIGQEKGNCTLGISRSLHPPEKVLEAVFLLECIKHRRTHPDRFLAPTPIRVVIDQELQECTANWPLKRLSAGLGPDPQPGVVNEGSFREVQLPALFAAAEAAANHRRTELVAAALAQIHDHYDGEVSRLQQLAGGDQVESLRERGAQTAALRQEEAMLAEAIESSRLRLDAIRLIRAADEGAAGE